LNAISYKLIDDGHTVSDGMTTYPGLPAPVIGDYLSRKQSWATYSPGTEYHIGRIEMVANAGTYIDAPFHRYRDGADLSGLPLHKLANLDGLVIRTNDHDLSVSARESRAIDARFFRNMPQAGRAVLVHAGWPRHWGSK
jgi:arylformamidase